MYPLLLLHKAGNLLSPVPCSLVHRFPHPAANYIYLQKGLDQEVFLPGNDAFVQCYTAYLLSYCIHRAGAFFGVTYVYINFSLIDALPFSSSIIKYDSQRKRYFIVKNSSYKYSPLLLFFVNIFHSLYLFFEICCILRSTRL